MNDYPIYYPERPTPPCEGIGAPPPCPTHDGYCGPEHRPHPPQVVPGPPAPHCPPGHNPCVPQIHPVPPVPTPAEGSSLYEQMGMLSERVNVCINQWNNIQANCYEALNQVVEAARSNDVYYDDCEVKYTEGYDETEGAAYAIVEKKVVDRQGRPIRIQLMPAFNNTSNPGVRQKIFDASFIKSANVIITASQSTQNTWSGPAMIGGASMPGTEQENGYVYGFTKGGALRYFPSDVTYTTLCQQGMTDVIGGCVPILYDGKLLEDVEAMTDKEAVTAIGFNSGTGSVFFFSCSSQNEPGMGIASVARVLQGYGCTTAVVTSHQVNSITCEFSEGMLYMGQMTTDPVQAREPENAAFWVVTKAPCFHNRFQKEIADLVQLTGQNAWKTYLLGVQIQSFDQRILDNSKAIEEERRRAMQAENWLQININKEVDRAMQAEEWLQENINKEVDRATRREDDLEAMIRAETERAEGAESNLNILIKQEEQRAKAAELQLKDDINSETNRAINREREIQDQLEREITARINADKDIIQSIEQEVLARQAADTELRTLIEKNVAEINTTITNVSTNVTNNTNSINGIISGEIELPYLKLTGGTLTGNLTMSENNTVILGRAPTQDMDAVNKKYLDDVIKDLTPGEPSPGVSKEYVDNAVSGLQTQIDGKVAKAGDSMTGALNMQGNSIIQPVLSSAKPIEVTNGNQGNQIVRGVATPVEENDAATKGYTDEAITSALEGLDGKWLPLAGGDMTGTINMTGQSQIKFYDQTGSTVARANKSLVDQELKGIVTNSGQDMQVLSESGGIVLQGTDVNIRDGAGTPIALTGVASSHSGDLTTPGYTVTENQGLNVIGAYANFLQNGDTYAPVGTGDHSLYNGDSTLNAILSPHNGHLDINVTDAKGSVYINRNGTAGGTGELWTTEIHSPQQLIVSPATSLSMTNHRIRNMMDAELAQDAVTLKQLQSATSGLSRGPSTCFSVVNDTTLRMTRPDGSYEDFNIIYKTSQPLYSNILETEMNMVNGFLHFKIVANCHTPIQNTINTYVQLDGTYHLSGLGTTVAANAASINNGVWNSTHAGPTSNSFSVGAFPVNTTGTRTFELFIGSAVFVDKK